MANHFSALKRARQTEKRSARNRANTSRLRSALRQHREALATSDRQAAEQVYRQTVSALDKAIQKGVIHENTATRCNSLEPSAISHQLSETGGRCVCRCCLKP